MSSNKTEVGSYFVSNYPPYSFWKQEFVEEAQAVLQKPPDPETPLGLYMHIPFCRKRCSFCYFKVYTDKNKTHREEYLDALLKEIKLYRELPVWGNRDLHFIYLGGGTPSALDESQIRGLGDELKNILSWEKLQEVTFECEPGTLTEQKLSAIKDFGITRLSLGVENFDDTILKQNGRAHLSAEIFNSYGWAQKLGFKQINIDLIAGMVGETDENWKACVEKTIEMAPDSVTVYQMELPYNTVYSKEMLEKEIAAPVADWETKRAWAKYAFDELKACGYTQSGAYTMTRTAHGSFVYRDAIWHGADMIGTGVASFSHVQGVHFQNVDTFEKYVGTSMDSNPPLNRALVPTPDQRMIREMILQMKLGVISASYFNDKFEQDILTGFKTEFSLLEDEGMLSIDGEQVVLTEKGLLQVDSLLPHFYESEHQHARYT